MASVRFSRPDGISQLNRSNIFFLILRRLADEQRSLMQGATKELIRRSIIGAILPLLVFVHVTKIDYVWIIFIAMELGSALLVFMKYYQLQRLVSESIISTVEEMIYSNDYQLANLNNEELVNMTNRCSWINGRLTEYTFQGRIITMFIASIEILFVLCSFFFWI